MSLRIRVHRLVQENAEEPEGRLRASPRLRTESEKFGVYTRTHRLNKCRSRAIRAARDRRDQRPCNRNIASTSITKNNANR